jgi:CheY-like chemotaxis protein
MEEMGGFDVRTENNPTRATAAVRQFAPDLIVLDIRMPDLDGADVILRIRNDPSMARIPVIFLTGNVTEEETGRLGGRLGNCRLLPKTMPLENLATIFKEFEASASAQSGAVLPSRAA